MDDRILAKGTTVKIYMTKAGKKIVVSFTICIAIFLLCGGGSWGAKIREERRVAAIPNISDSFSDSDILYHNWQTLKSSFTSLHTKIAGDIKRLKDLQNAYPKNAELTRKIQTYQNYLASMDAASFDCPEHITIETEQRSRSCSKCKGKGKRFLFRSCKECKGTGTITFIATISKECPHCGKFYQARISAESLLN